METETEIATEAEPSFTTTAQIARAICANVGALVYWRPQGMKCDHRRPHLDPCVIMARGVDMPYQRPAFR